MTTLGPHPHPPHHRSGPTIGILGGGQLARMLALAAYPLGLRVKCWDTSPYAPAGEVCELVVGEYDRTDALERFLRGTDIVTYEFENIPAGLVRQLALRAQTFPPPEAIETGQDRLAEKRLFQNLGFAVHPFAPVDSLADLLAALDGPVGLPAVLKTRRMGYDGKGQALVRTRDEAVRALEKFGARAMFVERFVPFDRELSILGVRGRGGEVRFYPLVENRHAEGILRVSRAPAPGWTMDLQERVAAQARRLLEALNYVGVLAIELFEAGGELLANEMAPRVHNSGHWTIEGAQTSQFENHIRAVAGLPLGRCAPTGNSVMVNLIGETPSRESVLAIEGAHLHLYAKEPRSGRKVGHVTVVDHDPAAAMEIARRVRALPGADG